MYEIAKKSREAMKDKARRLAGGGYQKTDSSNWTPAEPLNADKKTGLRPIGKKCGGMVEGAPTAFRADRKPRKAGGRVESEKKEAKGEADAYVNRDVKKANAKAEGKFHDGGLKNGGRAKKNLGGVMEVLSPAYGLLRAAQRGGKDEGQSQKDMLTGAALANANRKSGGKVKKAAGGSLPSPQEAMDSEARTKGIRVTDTKMPKPEEAAARSGKAPQDVPGRKAGGKADERAARATGGRAKGKGKTNISINILAGGKAPSADMGAAMPPGPGAVPVPTPAPAPTPAAPPPAVMPVPMPMGGGQPPMGRKRGGRVYSSYKDMDAGAATGDGRLEKTEIQQKKRRA